MAKDTYYFSHDYNARNDSKIKRLLTRHGYLGYGLFWAIVEDLYNNANALPTDYESIAFDLRTTKELVVSIINDFDLFCIETSEFGSASIERRLNERNEKSVKARESAFKRWNKEKENANALPTQSECNAIKERKVKESKVNELKESKVITPIGFFEFEKKLIEYGFEKNLIVEWLSIRKKKKAVNSETAFNGFVKEIEKCKDDKNEILKYIITKSWQGFEAKWLDNSSYKKTETKGINHNTSIDNF